MEKKRLKQANKQTRTQLATVKGSILFHLEIWTVRIKYRKLTGLWCNRLLTTPDTSDTSLNKTNPPAPGRSGTSFTGKSTLYGDFKINCALVGSHGMEEQCLRRLPHQGTKGGRPCYLSPGAILFTHGHCCSHIGKGNSTTLLQ